MISLKSASQLERMRAAGLVVATALDAVRAAVGPGVSTADLDAVAAESIRAAGASPSFLGYFGYPATLCTSVNDEVVHGIPSRTTVLREGDVVSVDCGAVVDGWHADSAVTVAVGSVGDELVELMRVCEDGLWAGIAAARVGGRLGDISAAVETSIRSSGLGIVEDYVGHGIGTELHQEPEVPNVGRAGRGLRLQPGLVLAIEPMVTLGRPLTRQLDDGWTVVTRDGSYAAHFEHTVALTDDGPRVLTAHDEGASRLAASVGTRAAGSRR